GGGGGRGGDPGPVPPGRGGRGWRRGTLFCGGAGGTPSSPRASRSAFPPLLAESPPGGPPLPAPPRQEESGRGVGEQADAPAEQRPQEPELPRRSAQVNDDEQDVDGGVDRRVDVEPDLAPCHRLRAGECALFQHRLCSFSRAESDPRATCLATPYLRPQQGGV